MDLSGALVSEGLIGARKRTGCPGARRLPFPSRQESPAGFGADAAPATEGTTCPQSWKRISSGAERRRAGSPTVCGPGPTVHALACLILVKLTFYILSFGINFSVLE